MRSAWVPIIVAVSLAGCMPEHVPIELREFDLVVDPRSVTVVAGGTVALGAALRGPRLDLSDAPIDWISRDDRVVSVSERGQLRGLSSGSSFVVASYGSHRDSVSVTVVPAQRPLRGAALLDPNYPNEPPENELIAHSRMDEPFPWGPAELTEAEGFWWQYPAGDPRSELRLEDGVPKGPHYNRTTYEAGLGPGRAPVNWGAWNAGSSQQGDEYERIYLSMHLRLVPGGRVGWESQRVGTKLGFVGVGRCRGANNEFYPLLEGGTRTAFTLRMGQQNVRSAMWGQNRMRGPVMHAGRWHHWEIEMILNQVDRPDGVMRWWVDGRLIMEHRDVLFRTSEHPCGFLAWKWNPTWGGTGGPDKAQEDYIDISDVRISGRPLDH